MTKRSRANSSSPAPGPRPDQPERKRPPVADVPGLRAGRGVSPVISKAAKALGEIHVAVGLRLLTGEMTAEEYVDFYKAKPSKE